MPIEPRDPLLVEREKTHGPYIHMADKAQQIKQIMKTNSQNWYRINNRQAEALEMIASKIGRILSGNCHDKDHWDDIAGYAKLGAEACEN